MEGVQGSQCAVDVSCVLFGFDSLILFPKAAAKGSFEKSVAIKDFHQSSAGVMAVFKDCNQTLPKVLLK